MRIGIWMISAISLLLVIQGAADAETRVKEVEIQGNERIETDAIRQVIQTEAGDTYNKDRLSADLEAIYQMGYFDDVRVSVEKKEAGNIVIFTVEEKPTLRRIEFEGNLIFDDEEIEENVDISSGAILNIARIKSNISAIERFYKDKNYHNVKVDYEIKELDHNRADLKFIIEEGKKVRIKEIRLEGNQAYSDKELKKLIKTSEKGFFSWLTSSGDLDMQTLEQDVYRIESHYQNNGYAEARVAQPEVSYEGDWIYITIKIHEGPRFKVGELSFKGELLMSEDKLMEKISINERTYYSREALRNGVMTLSELYADRGYARADIRPQLNKHPDEHVMDIVFNIEKKQPIYFEKIVIEGNTKTRDKVIRRELQVHEQEKYSDSRLKRSIRNLHRLDYFKDVNVDTMQGSSENQMILNIDVTEKATGSFSLGAGYSSVENLYVTGSISERNLFGRGQKIELRGQMGSQSRQFRFLFTEPWLFDIPLSATIEAYNWDRDYDDYERDSKGGKLRFGYPLYDYTRGYLSYAYDISEIYNVSSDYTHLIDKGRYIESSVTASVVYDSRDSAITPTEGSRYKVSLEYAGLGGDIGFIKPKAELGKYFPLFWETVGFLHAEGGRVWDVGGKYLPDYEKFYLGGIDSLRGFDWRDVCVRDEDGKKVGGEKYVQFNAEFLFPLIKAAGLRGVLFYDTGNVYKRGKNIDLGDMRESVGYGIRWYSPLGPLRLERGYILDRKEGEDSGRWEFAIGGAF
ncbi:MAG: outer membrane protein assembly factor BamA [Desulfobacteraceae bacterium]|nr:outer membrane protein assembly factor BamA [Desulfobacteraceae bacterium]